MRRQASIVRRLALYIGLSLAATSLILFISARTFLAEQLRERDKRYIAQEAKEYATTLTESGLSEVARRYSEESHRSDDLALFIRIISPEGKNLLERSPDALRHYNIESLQMLSADQATGWHLITGVDGEASVLDIVGEEIPTHEVVQVGMSSDFRDNLLEEFSSIFVVFAGLSLLGSSVAGILIARSSLRPLLEFRNSLKKISDSVDVAAVVPRATSSDYREISELSEVFNTLLDRRYRLITSMRSVLDTIAHETKSPLTRLRMHAERALLSGTEADKVDSLVVAIEETDRVSRFIDVIMEVAEAEGKFFKLAYTVFDPQDALTKVHSLYEDVASEAGVLLTIATGDSAPITADFNQVVQALSNLVDNAIKFTPAGESVILSFRSTPETSVYSVKDFGPGVPQDELPLIWQRLFRGVESQDKAGLGLGLSLVQAIAVSHGGSVHVVSVPRSGSEFLFVIPSIPGSPSLSPEQQSVPL